MQPLKVDGEHGPHSASHRWMYVTGALELAEDRAKVRLEIQVDQSYIRCPKAWQNGPMRTMQACASDDVNDTRTRQVIELTGDARQDGGGLEADLRGGEDLSLGLRCTPVNLGLGCAVTDDTTVFYTRGNRPRRIVFAASSSKQYRIEPIALADGGQMSGKVTLDAEAALVEVELDGKPPAVLPGAFYWTPAGLIIEARTEPTRTFTMTCKDVANRLECDVTAYRTLPGQQGYLHTPAVLVAD